MLRHCRAARHRRYRNSFPLRVPTRGRTDTSCRAPGLKNKTASTPRERPGLVQSEQDMRDIAAFFAPRVNSKRPEARRRESRHLRACNGERDQHRSNGRRWPWQQRTDLALAQPVQAARPDPVLAPGLTLTPDESRSSRLLRDSRIFSVHYASGPACPKQGQNSGQNATDQRQEQRRRASKRRPPVHRKEAAPWNPQSAAVNQEDGRSARAGQLTPTISPRRRRRRENTAAQLQEPSTTARADLGRFPLVAGGHSRHRRQPGDQRLKTGDVVAGTVRPEREQHGGSPTTPRARRW